MSVLNSSWPHGGESLTTQEPGPPENLDSDPGHMSEEDPKETFAQVVRVLPFPLRPACLYPLYLLPFPSTGR